MDKQDIQRWNGEGLPPVGTVCEIGNEYRIWSCGEVMYVSELTIVFKYHKDNGDDTEGCYFPRSVNFRPVRSPEQIEAERRKRVSDAFRKAFQDVRFSEGWKEGDSMYSAIYDAIRAGKIEGVKIDG